MAIISADVDCLEYPKEDMHQIVDKLAEFVVDWNVNKEYSNFQLKRKPNVCNCQDFVEALLRHLNLDYDFTGALGTFLSDMRNRGTCEMEFKPNVAFMTRFNLSSSKYVFTTHEQLDTFIIELLRKNPSFQSDYKSEWSLLKSFDRAFWLRYLKNTKEAPKDVIPKDAVEVDATMRDENNRIVPYKKLMTNCPFNDPRITFSLC